MSALPYEYKLKENEIGDLPGNNDPNTYCPNCFKKLLKEEDIKSYN